MHIICMHTHIRMHTRTHIRTYVHTSSFSLDNHREQPYSGEVQLIRGEYPSEGRLAVFFNGQWGGVCSSGFDPLDGDVVCRQMGYTHVENIITSNVDRLAKI